MVGAGSIEEIYIISSADQFPLRQDNLMDEFFRK